MKINTTVTVFACLLINLATINQANATSAIPTVYSGTGKDSVTLTLSAFREAIGGDAASRISWDGVKLDGTDANPNTRVIDLGKTVEIPVDRFRNVGAIYADPYTVSGDGFASVNPGTEWEFPAFSPNNTFAMFDPEGGKFKDRQIQQTFVLPGTDTAAGTRGFGVVFIDVELQNSSTIEYFGTDAYGQQVSLGKFAAPTGKSGEPQFVGVVFDAPIITGVTVTPGARALFSFDGQYVQPFGDEDLHDGIDLAVTDDFLFAKPEAAQTAPSPENNRNNWRGIHPLSSTFPRK